jgi:hypothetical protein
VTLLAAGKLVVQRTLDGELGLRAGAAGMSSVRVARELYRLVLLELKGLLEPLADLKESLLALLSSPSLALLASDGAANCPCPETDTVEASPHVDHDTHDLVVLLVLKVLADGCEHDMQPERVDVDGLLVLELERPLAAVLVLRIFPLGSYALLEQVVVGLERKIGGGGNVVLWGWLAGSRYDTVQGSLHKYPRTPRPSRMK